MDFKDEDAKLCFDRFKGMILIGIIIFLILAYFSLVHFLPFAEGLPVYDYNDPNVWSQIQSDANEHSEYSCTNDPDLLEDIQEISKEMSEINARLEAQRRAENSHGCFIDAAKMRMTPRPISWLDTMFEFFRPFSLTWFDMKYYLMW